MKLTALCKGVFTLKIPLPKSMRIMKLIVFFMVATCLQVSANGYSQKISISGSNVTLEKVCREIEKQSDYLFWYESGLLKPSMKVSVSLIDADLNTVLDATFKGQPFVFEIIGKTIVVKKKDTGKPFFEKVDQLNSVHLFIDFNGRVLGKDGKPIEGASVTVKGTDNGTSTNALGAFSLKNVAPNSTLIVSSVGFATRQVNVGNNTRMDIVLEVYISTLDETVVIGYGSVRRGDLTGSISSVAKEVLDNSTFTDIGQAIQGQIAGVHILTGDGSPGEPVQVTVRGIGSFLGNTEPLLVVDGIPMPSNFNFNDMNPNNISSIDVLKGASASAIYGSRAASGVILIQTKQGQFNEKTTVNYSYNIGIDKMASKIDVLSADEWKYMLFEGARNAAIADGITNIESYLHFTNYTAPGFFREYNTNWMDEMLQPSTLQTHNLSIMGGTAAARYTGSFGLTDDQGIMKESGYKRYNVSFGLNNRISPKFSSDISIRANFTNRDNATATLYDAIAGRPDYPAYNDDGTPFVNVYYLANGDPRLIESPLSKLLDNINNNQVHLIGISGYLQYNFTKNLNVRSRVNYNLNESKTKLFYANTTSLGSGTGFTKAGSLTDTRMGSTQMEWENQLNYSYKYKDHKFDLTAVTSFLQENRKSARISFDDFPDNHIQNEFYQGATYKSSAGYNNNAAMISYVGRVNYNFKGKYLLTASVRSDGSSKFSPDNAYGTFPSLAIAWNVSKESFLKDVAWVNFLKIRGGIGKTGMADVGYYAWRTLYDATNYNGASGVIPGQAGNEALRWENSDQSDLAIDFQLFDSRFRGSVGYYIKNTDGLLYPFTLAPSTGFRNVTVNFAKVKNSGLDIEWQLDVLRKKDLTWTIGFNLNNNKNIVKNLDKDYVTGTDGSQALTNTIIKEGEPFGLIYGFKTDGIYRSWEQVYADQALSATAYSRYLFPGEIRYSDLDSNGWVDVGVATPIGNKDRTILGRSLPDFSGGFSSFVTYKQWNLRVFATYSVGNDKVWSQETYSFAQGLPAQPKNMWSIALDRWTPENPDSRYPSFRLNRTTIAREFNDFSVYDASYLKLQNVQLLYDLNQYALSKLKLFSKVQVYGSVNNLHVFTNYPGLNVESYSRGDRISGASIDNSLYPAFITFNFGLKTTLK